MSKKTNSEIRRIARESLDGHWGKAAFASLIFFIVTNAAILLFYFIPFGQIELPEGEKFNTLTYVAQVLLLPLNWGFYLYFLRIIRREQLTVSHIFDGYKDFTRIFLTGLLMYIYIFLWCLLLIVPGIIKALSYAMTPYILRDRPDLNYDAAIRESMRLMRGNKMKLFLLELSFIGWGILALLTLGMGFFLLVPYFRTSLAAFYEDLKYSDAEVQSSTLQEETTIEVADMA